MINILKLEPAIALNEGQFFSFCQQNPELKIERSPQGELIIMPPTGGKTGRKNAELIAFSLCKTSTRFALYSYSVHGDIILSLFILFEFRIAVLC